MKLKNMVRCGLCAALMVICGWMAVPVGDTAITMQTFGVFFTLTLLGGGKGTAVCCVYLLLGAVGFPVFSGFQGGIGILLGPTGGYLFGFLLTCLTFWLLEKRLPVWLNMGLSLLVCYACGSVWFYFAYTQGGLWAVVLKCVVPYLLPDGLKLTLAWTLGNKMKKIIT
jgi:biotin transport system substrate-specific component